MTKASGTEKGYNRRVRGKGLFTVVKGPFTPLSINVEDNGVFHDRNQIIKSRKKSRKAVVNI